MFQLENKYKQINDFMKRVIEPAQKELSEKAPFSFTYKTNCIKKKIISLTFFPHIIAENVDDDLERKTLQKQTALTWDLDKMIVDYLKQNYLFETDEIKHNIETFKEANEVLDLMLFLAKKRRLASTKKNPKGYIINALRSEVIKVKS